MTILSLLVKYLFIFDADPCNKSYIYLYIFVYLFICNVLFDLLCIGCGLEVLIDDQNVLRLEVCVCNL